jgi:uronate dehydrogenase
MTVLLTGAAGRIGTELSTRLPDYGWQLRPFDLAYGQDVTSPADLDAALPGVTAIVHLAGVADEAPWPVVRDANVEGAVQVFEAARRHAVARVVYASSNHAVGFEPRAMPGSELPAELPPRPDTLYGVSKAFGEALGRYYADRYGMRVACLRIGTFTERPADERTLSTWLSPADCARLVDAALRSERLSYAVVWGVSANTRRYWSLDAGFALGYRPADDAEAFADQIAAALPDPSDGLVGGGFTSAGFGIDEIAARWRQ